MTFNDLTATADLMREPNADYLGDKTDNQLKELKRKSALLTLESDLLNDTGLSSDNLTAIDEIVSNYEFMLNTALTYKQLQLFYYEINDVIDGSLTLFRYNEYKTMYDDLRKGFSKLSFSSTQSILVNSVNLMYG